MNLTEVHKAAAKLSGQLFKKSNSRSIGMLKSHFRGTGLQFKEHQVYEHGDDVRFIDWKMLAKTNEPYIKTFEEERNVEITVVLDATSSMFYGHKGISKLQCCLEIISLLFLISKETNDFIRVLFVGKKVIDIPKANGIKGITNLLLVLGKEGVIDDDGKIILSYGQNDHENSIDLEKEIVKHLRFNREIIILSGWGNVFREISVNKALYKKNVHAFRVMAPIDNGEVEQVALHTFSQGSKRSQFSVMDSKNLHSTQLPLKRIKDISLKGSYLDEFVKEMI